MNRRAHHKLKAPQGALEGLASPPTSPKLPELLRGSPPSEA